MLRPEQKMVRFLRVGLFTRAPQFNLSVIFSQINSVTPSIRELKFCHRKFKLNVFTEKIREVQSITLSVVRESEICAFCGTNFCDSTHFLPKFFHFPRDFQIFLVKFAFHGTNFRDRKREKFFPRQYFSATRN